METKMELRDFVTETVMAIQEGVAGQSPYCPEDYTQLVEFDWFG
jgi:hypothetical protein